MRYGVNVRIDKAEEEGYLDIIIVKADEETTYEQLEMARKEFEEMTGFSASDIDYKGKKPHIIFRVSEKELKSNGNKSNMAVRMAMDELTRRQIVNIEEIIQR